MIERLSDAARVANRQKRKATTDKDMKLLRDLKPMDWERRKRERERMRTICSNIIMRGGGSRYIVAGSIGYI